MKVCGRQIFFRKPTSCDIVIFDETNSQLIKNVVDPRYHTVIFNMRPEDIFIDITVFLNFFKCFFKHDIAKEIRHRRGFLIGAASYARHVYLEASLVAMNPKAVITFIDNSGEFHWLSKNCRSFPFIAVQNGARLSYVATGPAKSAYYLQHLFTYGEHETHLFPRLGYKVENYHPIGSLLASLNFFRNQVVEEIKYDILIVSTWRGNIGFQQEVQDTMRSMKIMDLLLAKYIRCRNIKAAVILRAERGSEHWYIPQLALNEEDYYKEIYGNDVAIIETDFKTRNIFPLIEQSRMVISCLSSAIFEAFGIGKKVLFCNFTGVEIYHQDIDASILIKNAEERSFFAELDQILAIPQQQYVQDKAKLMKYYMSFHENKPSYRVIAEKVNEIIATHKK